MPRPKVGERTAAGVSGWPMLGAVIVASAVAVALLFTGQPVLIALAIVLIVAAAFVFVGLTAVAPGEARVVQLLGRYAGTIRTDGLRWVNPLTTRRKISTRIRNHETERTKVNDAEGNPIEI